MHKYLKNSLQIKHFAEMWPNQFLDKKGVIGKPERTKGTLAGPHVPVPTFPVSSPQQMVVEREEDL